MRTLVLGGVKSGKSGYAEQQAKDSGLPVVVIATAEARDAEMQERIARHKADRPSEWPVIEEPFQLGSILDTLNQQTAEQCVIVDCLTLWLTQLLESHDEARYQEQRARLLGAVQNFSGRLLLISNENSLGITPMGELSRHYLDEAGLLHQAIARQCDQAVMVIAGLALHLK